MKPFIFFVFLFVFSNLVSLTASDFNITFKGQLPYNQTLSGIWSYAAPDGTEYAIVGTRSGTSIVDISDPSNPEEKFFIQGATSDWREIRTFEHYAYITTEGGGGLQILNLSNLPNNVNVNTWTGPANEVNTAHTIFIDENGFAFVNGFNNADGTIPGNQRGFLILDLNANPINPPIVGSFSDAYVHDCYGRNDTIYAALIYQGIVAVIDVSDKANLQIIQTFETPSLFTHNTWLSDDGKTLFTTDEVSGAYIAAYDISNLNSPQLLDRIRILPGSGLIPHNVHYLNGFLVASYYRTGVVVIDARYPDNLIEVGRYNTSIYSPSNGFNGCWGIDPYLPSGNVIASDIENGLFILKPDYERAAYLEGLIINSNDGFPLISADIKILGTSQTERTNLNGEYKTGAPETGEYTLEISRSGCTTKTTNVNLYTDSIIYKNFVLNCTTTNANEVSIAEVFYQLDVTNSQILLKNQMSNESLLVNIYDISGRIHSNFAINALELKEINQPPTPGIYFIHIFNTDKQIHSVEKVYLQ
ncbi:MAG: choice-of-anchor B family protein [Chitinophagaceae bacterium]|nr:MAG: choice-of-anchor B family protein [Chitinophagaceae bacterium]